MTELLYLPTPLLYTFAGLFGLMLGSFFNVVIVRLPTMMERQWQRDCAQAQGQPLPEQAPYNLSIPRSHCPHCQAPVKAIDNIPLISYLVLKGRCRHCAAPIAKRYPLIELISAGIPILCLAYFGIGQLALAYSVLLWALLILCAIDAEHMLLPDQITLPLVWAGLLASITILPISPVASIVGGATGYLFLWLLFWVFKGLTGKEGLGFGDFKLLAALGAWLGWQMLPMVVLLASFSGAIFGIGLMLFKRKSKGSPMPFGPFLAAGGVIALFYGEHLYRWYWQFAGLA